MSSTTDSTPSTTVPTSPSPSATQKDQGGASSNLYLFTFLATLVLLLAISSAIVTRSFILRRRFRLRVEEALAQGYILGPPNTRGQVLRRIGQQPKLHDAWIDIPKEKLSHQDIGLLWEDIKPLSALPVSSSYEADVLSSQELEQEIPLPILFPDRRRRRNNNDSTQTRTRPRFLDIWSNTMQRDDMIAMAYETRHADTAAAPTSVVHLPSATTAPPPAAPQPHTREQTDATLVEPTLPHKKAPSTDKLGESDADADAQHLQISVLVAMPVPPNQETRRDDDEEEIPNVAIGTVRCVVKGGSW